MMDLMDLGEVISTDVLVIGGGISGLVAAIKVKEESPELEVIIVERETTGYSGKAPKGGGFFLVFTPGADLDKFVEYHVQNIGIYLEGLGRKDSHRKKYSSWFMEHGGC
jgi:succinate dehydrogenase / fumarate reductase flavoprotein subunit